MMLESVLRRLVGGETGAAPPPALEGALGLALARAAQDSIGLPLVTLSVARGSEERAQLVAGLDASALLVGLGPPGAITGLAAIEPQLRCAVVESQTLGAPRGSAVTPGPVTGTEAAMMAPLLHGLLSRLAALDMPGLPPIRDVRPGQRLPDARAAGLILPEARYGRLSFEVEIGPASGRFGRLLLALSEPAKAADDTGAERWQRALRETVLQAPAELEAVLHRWRVPAREAEGFAPGDLVMLPGVDLSAVRLEDARGREVAKVRLGQRAGLRAVRLAPPEPKEDLPEIPPRLPG